MAGSLPVVFHRDDCVPQLQVTAPLKSLYKILSSQALAVLHPPVPMGIGAVTLAVIIRSLALSLLVPLLLAHTFISGTLIDLPHYPDLRVTSVPCQTPD